MIPGRTDVDYADKIALLAKIPSRDEYQLLKLEQAVEGIGLLMTADLFQSRRRYLHSKWRFSEISGLVHVYR